MDAANQFAVNDCRIDPPNAGRRLKIGLYSSSCKLVYGSYAASFVFSPQSNTNYCMHRYPVAVFFGGPSPEHEVSVITGLQAVAALRERNHDVLPVYVSKGGRWFTGKGLDDVAAYKDTRDLEKQADEMALAPGPGRSLRLVPLDQPLLGRRPGMLVDAVLLAFHGGSGENGGVQGLCESLGVPYSGAGVMASSVGMDKVRAKLLCRAADVPVVDWMEVTENGWAANEESNLDAIISRIGFPAIVKPVHLGSSIGIARVVDREELESAIEEAFRYDASVMVETCVSNLREINCSVLGSAGHHQVSVLEEPVSADGTLSFEDKYMRGSSGKSGSKGSSASGMASLDRMIPAPVSAETGQRITGMASRVFDALDGCGVARIDFLMDDSTGDVYFNEINTIPGSLSFYLWEPTGLPFADLLERLLELAVERFESRSRRVRSFETNLLSERAAGGLKGKLGS
jgi:D-alanine-D-alanine ligase